MLTARYASEYHVQTFGVTAKVTLAWQLMNSIVLMSVSCASYNHDATVVTVRFSQLQSSQYDASGVAISFP